MTHAHRTLPPRPTTWYAARQWGKRKCKRCDGYGTIINTDDSRSICPACDGRGYLED